MRNVDTFSVLVRALTRALAIFAVLEVLTGVPVKRVLLHHPFAVICIVVLLAIVCDLPDLLPDCALTRRKHDEAPSCRRRP